MVRVVTISLPLITGLFNPGHTMFILPTPWIWLIDSVLDMHSTQVGGFQARKVPRFRHTWPLLRSTATFLLFPAARPLLRPALLTEVTPFQICSAGSLAKKLVNRHC